MYHETKSLNNYYDSLYLRINVLDNIVDIFEANTNEPRFDGELEDQVVITNAITKYDLPK